MRHFPLKLHSVFKVPPESDQVTKDKSCPQDYVTNSVLSANLSILSTDGVNQNFNEGNLSGSNQDFGSTLRANRMSPSSPRIDESRTNPDENGRDKVYTICFGDESSCEETNYTLIDPRKKRETEQPKSDKSMLLESIDKCYLLNFNTLEDKIVRLFELLTLIGSLAYIYQAFKELHRLGLDIFLQTWTAVPGRVMFISSCILIVICLPLRLVCEPRVEDRLVAAAMFLTPMHFLFFCR